MILHGYQFFVIDHLWELAPTVDQFFKSLVDIYPPKSNFDEFQDMLSIATAKWKYAQQLADELGWEGDFVGEPRVFCLPDPKGMTIDYGFVFKQYNNGMTYVISPIYLDYIAEFENVQYKRLITD
ncbi:hypothetical protein ABJ384_04965 [Acinetobacter sp. A1-4-2]|uniref:Uncharacterized protein n=1 Tax=Acinetobacter sp. A1-4-2 TaxID=3156489 RepID=A0AAU7SZB1_9GAMM